MIQWIILATLSQSQLDALRSMYHVAAPVVVESNLKQAETANPPKTRILTWLYS